MSIIHLLEIEANATTFCYLCGMTMKYAFLQHLVRFRWEELSPVERRNFANVALDVMSEIANPSEEWALKSQTAALVAEVYISSIFTVV